MFKKIKRIIFKLLYKLPINNKKIVVDNFYGKGFADNPKYIVMKLHELAEYPLDIVWFVNKLNIDATFPSYVRKVCIDKYRFFSKVRYRYECATSHVWIDNIKNFPKGEKKDGQFYIQTWHGAISFKKVEKAAIETLDPKYIKASQYDSTQIDLMISNSKWFTDDVKKNFWYSGNILNTGTPRNDIFFKNNKKIKERVKKFYHLDKETKIILYAPTFRSYLKPDKQETLYEIDANKIVKAFSKKYNKNFVVIKRLHPNVSAFVKINENEYLKNGSIYPDMQDLLISSFALITDFSSSIFDFMLINERIFLFAKDYEDYIEKERGLNFNIKNDLPFPFAENENELVSFIDSFDEAAAKKSIDIFKDKLQLKEDGYASKRVARIILDKIDEK